MYILVFIIILAILVLIHEAGHYFAAKKQGILVEEFGFGFPPRLWGFKRGETLYSINLLPIGGFVKLYGEEYHEGEAKVDPKLKDRAFVYKKPWQKAIVIVAGVVMNFLLGWILISYLFTQGVPTPSNHVLVDAVSPGSPAARAGLHASDQILQIAHDGKTYQVKTTEDLVKYGRDFAGTSVIFVVERNSQPVQIAITPRKNPPAGQGALGISVTSFIERKYPWYEAPYYGLGHAFTITAAIATELGKTLYKVVIGQGAKVEVSGPVGIAQYTGTAIKFGRNAVLELMALLSLNLAIINILPFPALDGGRLVFIVYEWIFRRPVNKNFEQRVNMAGMIVLLGLAALITVHDVVKLQFTQNVLKQIFH
jgi:regulator of sigma E protease